MAQAIMTLNVGSSSIKFGLYQPPQSKLLISGKVTRLNNEPRLQARWVDSGRTVDQSLPARGIEACLTALLNWLHSDASEFELIAVGHRVVHGGPGCSAPVRVTADVLSSIERSEANAPYHNPHNLRGIRQLQERNPDLPHVACFDTYFHRTQPAVETRLALPRRFTEEGIRRYGFHGLSYEYIASQLPRLDKNAAQGRTLVAHLGNGASMCALQAGRSLATTMGFTALEGLMMGQRCGNLDPGVVLYLQQAMGYSADEVAKILYRESGLKGVSGISNDMAELLASEAPEAQEAIDLFCHRAIREAGALIALLGGLDALVFTGGMGEKAPEIRRRISAGFHWLGLKLDDQANQTNKLLISTDSSKVNVWVIPTDEELVIAQHTQHLLVGSS